MKAIVLEIETLQPILATSFQGDPNSDVSYGYIPGSAIRGALIGRYLKRNPSLRDTDIVSDPAIRALFFDGTTRYLNAYLYDKQRRQRTLPTPLSWRRDKQASLSANARMEIFDLGQLIDAGLLVEISPRGINEPFCVVNDEDVWLHCESRRINVHNKRNRRKGRAIQGSGEIFRYDALDAGQILQAVILCDRVSDADTLNDLLNQSDIWLGGSQTAGYGHCRIKPINTTDTWTEVGRPVAARCDRKQLQVVLLSNLMFRDSNGQHVVTPPTALLQQSLDMKLNLHKSFVASQYVGGFNRKWGLPLPQVQVTSAGSVFVYELEDEPNTTVFAKLAELEDRGIGERCIDGFGRITFNWLDENEAFYGQKPAKRPVSLSLPVVLPEASNTLANTMATRLLRQKLDQCLLEEVNRRSIKDAPTNSQLSRLMLVARKALSQTQQETLEEDERIAGSRQLIAQLLENSPKNASRQLEKAKVGASSLKQTIEGWLDNPDSWLTHPLSVTIAGVTQEPTPLLKQEYTLQLIMAVSKKAMKENPND